MIPGPEIVVACPHCGGLGRYETLITGNSRGEELWTDLRVVRPMAPEPPPYVRCGGCRGFYWLGQAREVGAIPGAYSRPRGSVTSPVDPAWLRSPALGEPSVDDYRDALEVALDADVAAQCGVRARAFQRWNDHLRRGLMLEDDRPDPPGSALPAGHWQRGNLEALLGMLGSDFDTQLLLRGDILRGLGRFREAAQSYGRLASPGLSPRIGELQALCERCIGTPRRLR